MKPFARLLTVVAAVGCGASGFAAGIVLKGEPGGPITEADASQCGVILHKDGIQRMLVAADPHPERGEGATWVFAVPASADRVKVEAVDTFPLIKPFSPVAYAKDWHESFMLCVRLTQIYPIVVEVPGVTIYRRWPTIVPHMSATKAGVQVEAVPGDAVGTLSGYLAERIGKVPEGALVGLEPDATKDHTFIIVQVASQREAADELARSRKLKAASGYPYPTDRGSPCIYVEFPTDRLVCPLEALRAHGQRRMGSDVCVFVVGHVEARPLGPEGKRQGKEGRVYQYRYVQLEFPEGMRSLFGRELPVSMIPITEVRLRRMGEDFPTGLEFSPSPVPGLARAMSVYDFMHSGWAAVAWVACVATLSYLAAGLAGLVHYSRWRGYATIGLLNVFTVVGMWFLAGLLVEGKREGTTPRSELGVAFFLFFSPIFVVLTIVVQLLLGLLTP